LDPPDGLGRTLSSQFKGSKYVFDPTFTFYSETVRALLPMSSWDVHVAFIDAEGRYALVKTTGVTLRVPNCLGAVGMLAQFTVSLC